MLKFYLILLLLPATLLSQERDSTELVLENAIAKAISDSAKVDLIIELTRTVEKRNVTEGKMLMLNALRIIEENQIPSSYLLKKKARVLTVLGKYQSQQGNFKGALEYHLRSLNVSESIDDVLSAGSTYHNLGVLYRQLKDYTKSKDYLNKAVLLREPLEDKAKAARTFNMLGVTYVENNEFDSAFYYYKKAELLHSSELSKTKVAANIANLYSKRGALNASIPAYLSVLDIFLKLEDFISASITCYNISKDYLMLDQYSRALAHINESFDYAERANYKRRLPENLALRSDIYEKLGMYNKSLADFKKYKLVFDSLYSIEKATEFTTLQLGYDYEKEKLNLANEKIKAEVDTEKQKATTRRYFFLFLLAIIVIIGLYLFWRERQNLSKERLLKGELERQLLDERLKHITLDAKKLVADNKMRQQFKMEFLEKLKAHYTQKDNASSITSLITDLQSQIATESKFDQLIDSIERIDGSFSQKLQTEFPGLTRTEREICNLIRVNLSLKEITVILNLSIDSVKSYRYRIRKKIDLQQPAVLDTYIQNLFLHDSGGTINFQV